MSINFEVMLHPPKLEDFYFSFLQIYNMLECGFIPEDAISDAAKNVRNKTLQKALNNIVKDIKSGISVGDAFSKQKIFPKIIAPTIIAGDKAGMISQTFNRLADLFWLQINLYAKIKNALLVPKIAIFLLTGLIISYIKIAVPQYIKLYQNSKVVISPVVIMVSNFVNLLVDYWPVTVGAMFVIWQAGKLFCKANPSVIDDIKLHIPILSTLNYYFIQHQMTSILHIMLSSGLLLPDAMTQAALSVDNSIMKRNILHARDDLLSGYSLEDSLKRNNKHNIFDNQLIGMLARSEKSGQLVNSLEKLLNYYERLLRDLIEPTTTKISFVVLITIGTVIALMFFFCMSPMLDYLNNIMTLRGR